MDHNWRHWRKEGNKETDLLHTVVHHVGTRWRSWLRHCATSRKEVGLIPNYVIGIFHWHYPSRPGVDSICNRNEYWEYFVGSKGGRCVGLIILPPSCADCLETGSLNLLEPSGPVQVCTGIALSLPLPYTLDIKKCTKICLVPLLGYRLVSPIIRRSCTSTPPRRPHNIVFS